MRLVEGRMAVVWLWLMLELEPQPQQGERHSLLHCVDAPLPFLVVQRLSGVGVVEGGER